MYPVLPRDKLHEMLVILLDNCQKNAEARGRRAQADYGDPGRDEPRILSVLRE